MMTGNTVGVVNYINTSQIMIPWRRLGGPEGWNVLESTPTTLNRLLRGGAIEVGLISSFAYGQSWQDYLLFPGLGISAAGPVKSVLFIHREPLHELERIVTTSHSATSVNLLRIIVEDFLNLSIPFYTGGFEEFEAGGGTGYLAIGDEALRLSSLEGVEKEDLAAIWMEHTGLPFVFAVWAVRREAWERERVSIEKLYAHIVKCLDAGSAALGDIARAVAPRIPMRPDQCLAYLQGIRLTLGKEELEGLNRYFTLLEDLGLLKGAPVLQFAEIPR